MLAQVAVAVASGAGAIVVAQPMLLAAIRTMARSVAAPARTGFRTCPALTIRPATVARRHQLLLLAITITPAVIMVRWIRPLSQARPRVARCTAITVRVRVAVRMRTAKSTNQTVTRLLVTNAGWCWTYSSGATNVAGSYSYNGSFSSSTSTHWIHTVTCTTNTACSSCPAPKANGACGSDYSGECTQGNLNAAGVTTGGCDGTDTWTCDGVSGGSSSGTCSAPEGACYDPPGE